MASSGIEEVGDETRRTRIALCWRPIPARRWEEHPATRLLRDRGFDVVQTGDTHLPFERFDIVLLLENCRWFPKVLGDLREHPGRRPVLVVWHWEPLPLPKAAGVPAARLHLRELAKIALRDARVTDVYSNAATLRRLTRDGLPDILAVSSPAWQESLAESGVESHWVPYGYDELDAAPEGGPRDIDALFLGSLAVPRRRKVIRELRRRGVDVDARGGWLAPDTWGLARTVLVRRAHAFLHLSRGPKQISAERFLIGMSNRTLVVSEPIYRPEPFVAGEHYVEAEVSGIPEVLRYYRHNAGEREAIVDRAHRLATEELRMDAALGRLLSLIQDRSSATCRG